MADSSHRLALSVRPGRVATFVGDEDIWRPKAMRMLEVYSRKWGGAGDIVAPVKDGKVVPQFWRILADFDPDWLGFYTPTRRGRQLADPAGFETWLDDQSSAIASANPGITAAQARTMLQEDLTWPLSLWPHDGPIDREIKRRLAPIHRMDLVVGQRCHADGAVDSPLTDLTGLRELPGKQLLQLDASDIDRDLDLMLALRFGAVSPSYEKALKDCGVEVTRLKPDADDVGPLIALALSGGIQPGDWSMHKAMRSQIGNPVTTNPQWIAPDYWFRSAFGWSAFRCGWRQYLRKLPFLVSDWPFVFILGNTLADFSAGLALERLTANAFWAPLRLIEGEGELYDDVRREVIDFLDDYGRRRSDQEVHITSLSLSEDELTAVVDKLRAVRRHPPLGGENVYPKRFEDTKRGWPRRLYDERAEEIRYEAFRDRVTVGTITTPLPSVTGLDPEKVTWQIDVLVDELHFPARAAVSEIVVASGDAAGDRVRSGVEGVSYHSHSLSVFTFGGTPLHQRLARPRLRVPTAEEIFQALLEAAGLRGVRSNAGRFTQQTIDRFGGFDELLAALRSPVFGPILQAYRSKAPSAVDPGDFLNGVRRRFLSFADMQKLTSASGVTADALRALVDGYAERKILRRGLSLTCPVCRYAAWYRLSDLREEMTCQRCRSVWPIKQENWREPKDEPSWQYELDEVVFQSLEGNVLGPIVTLDHLRGKTRGFQFAPEMDVYEKDMLIAEVDVWAIVDGAPIVGEAKTTDTLDEKSRDAQVATRLLRVADAVTADELVFATTQPAWRKKSKDAIDTEAPKWPSVPARVMEGVT